MRQAAARAFKRVKEDSSDTPDSDGEFSSGSEFKLSGTDSVESDVQSDESRASSDFNPFDDDSDSEGKFVFKFFFMLNFYIC